MFVSSSFERERERESVRSYTNIARIINRVIAIYRITKWFIKMYISTLHTHTTVIRTVTSFFPGPNVQKFILIVRTPCLFLRLSYAKYSTKYVSIHQDVTKKKR